jgi:hypothetical protein
LLNRIIQKTEVRSSGNFGVVEQNKLRILDCGFQIEITDLLQI